MSQTFECTLKVSVEIPMPKSKGLHNKLTIIVSKEMQNICPDLAKTDFMIAIEKNSVMAYYEFDMGLTFFIRTSGGDPDAEELLKQTVKAIAEQFEPFGVVGEIEIEGYWMERPRVPDIAACVSVPCKEEDADD